MYILYKVILIILHNQLPMKIENMQNHIAQKDWQTGFGGFMKLLEVKIHDHDIKVCHMSWTKSSSHFCELILPTE